MHSGISCHENTFLRAKINVVLGTLAISGMEYQKGANCSLKLLGDPSA